MEVIPETSTSWGSWLNLAMDPLPEEDVLELDCGEDEDDASDLISKDKEEDDIFVTLAQAAQPAAPSPLRVEEWHASFYPPQLRHARRVQTRCCPAGYPLACCRSRVLQILPGTVGRGGVFLERPSLQQQEPGPSSLN